MPPPSVTRRLLLWLVGGLVVFCLLLLVSSPGLVSGARFVDADGYMRLLRVRELLDTGGWFDSRVARSNWPDGEVLHWSRAFDVVIVLLYGIFSLVLEPAAALHAAGVWVAPILLLGTFAVMVWACAPLIPAGRRGFVFLALLAQTTVLSYGLPARPDHHALVIFTLAVTLGFAIRTLSEPDHRTWPLGLGGAAAVGLWVSPEFLLPLGIVLVAGVLCWVVDGDEHLMAQRRWSGALVVGVSVCLVAEWGAGWRTVEYDRLSLAHLAVAAIAWGFWLGASGARGWVRTAHGRGLLGALVGTLGLALMAMLFPGFFRGPMSEVQDPLVQGWLAQISELQPLLFPNTIGGAGLLLTTAGSALLALPFLVGSLRRGEPPRGPRVLLLIGIVVTLGLSLRQARWVIYAELFSVVVLAELVVYLRGRIGKAGGSPVLADATRGAVSAALIAGPLLIGTGLLSVAGLTRTERLYATGTCDPEAIVAFFEAHTLDEEPRTIAAYMDLGPALLYRTPHRVLATPYHRNAEGIRKVHTLLTGTDFEAARVWAAEWEVDTIVLCPGRDEVLYGATSPDGPTLYGRLRDQAPPSWLVPMPRSEELRPALVFVRVD